MFLLLLMLWVILSARVTIEVLIFGALVSLAVYIFALKFLGFGPRRELQALRRLGHLFVYVGILVVEAVKSNIAVSRLVFSRDLRLKPRIIFFQTDLKKLSSRVLLSTSLTLTPGTIALALFDDVFCVHCLDESMEEKVTNSKFIKQLHKIEEKGAEND